MFYGKNKTRKKYATNIFLSDFLKLDKNKWKNKQLYKCTKGKIFQFSTYVGENFKFLKFKFLKNFKFSRNFKKLFFRPFMVTKHNKKRSI